MQKFETAEQQLETCMSIFNPLEVNIDVDKNQNITASLTYPNFAIAPKNRTIVFEVYLVDSVDFITSTSMTGTTSTTNFDFTYRLPIKKIDLNNKSGNGNTIVSAIDKDLLANGYAKVIGHLQNKVNDFVYDDKWKKDSEYIIRNLESVKLYALAYVVINDTKDTQSIRPDIAMQKYGLDETVKSDFDDLMLESVKSSIDKELKDKVYFSKKFLEIKDLNVADIVKNKPISASALPRAEDRFFVKVGG